MTRFLVLSLFLTNLYLDCSSFHSFNHFSPSLSASTKIALVNAFVGIISFPILLFGTWFYGLYGAVWALAISSCVNWTFNHFALQKEVSDKNIEITDNILNEQLISLDTLQEVYKKVLVESAKVQNLGTSINLADGNNSQNKELQLLAKREFVKDEITDLNLERARRNKTINIISDFPDSGAKVGGLANNLKIRYATLFIGFTILILLLLELNKFVKSYKKEKDH